MGVGCMRPCWCSLHARMRFAVCMLLAAVLVRPCTAPSPGTSISQTLAAGGAATRGSSRAAAAHSARNSMAASHAASLRDTCVVVVNDIPGHFEVLAGVVEVLRMLGAVPDVLYTGNPVYPLTWGLWAWLGSSTPPAEPGKPLLNNLKIKS